MAGRSGRRSPACCGIALSKAASPPPITPDGRYLVVRGRLWRTANPHLSEEQRAQLVAQLMTARRDVGLAMRNGDKAAEREARSRVDSAKIGLGERGSVWWQDGAPDYNRHMARNTPYAAWFTALEPKDL